MPTVNDLLLAFEAVRGYRPYPAQERAILSTAPATWLLAGPGTGKTEVLVLRVLRLLLVDRRPPEGVLVTTFTNRAARNLHDRLLAYTNAVCAIPPFSDAAKPNLSALWLGTLHSLAHDIMRQADPNSERLTVSDDPGATFRLLRAIGTGDLVDPDLYAVLNGAPPAPWNKFDRLHHAERLRAALDRVVEDDLDRDALLNNAPLRGEAQPWPAEAQRQKFLELLASYEEALAPTLDFSRLQTRFLEFLTSPAGRRFLKPDPTRSWPGITDVIVDEYQDTNPVQEEIYFALCRDGANLMVVGDDDQALYRFRGASVDAMIGFGARARVDLQRVAAGGELAIEQLDENRRSHPRIVAALNDYLATVGSTTNYSTARAPKRPLLARSGIGGEHEPFFVLLERDGPALARRLATTIAELQAATDITDLRQVALLASSTKESAASPFKDFADELRAHGLEVFNPGAKTLHRDDLLRDVVSLLCQIIDPHQHVLAVQSKSIAAELVQFHNRATKLRRRAPALDTAVAALTRAFDLPARAKGAPVPDTYPGSWNVLRILYELLNLPAL